MTTVNEDCRNKYDRNNIVFQAALRVGILDKVGMNLDVIPAWRHRESGEAQLDVILYGFHLGGSEWSPPKGVIHDAAASPSLSWIPAENGSERPRVPRENDKSTGWRRYQCVDSAWWDARERVIGCCERVGELFQRQDKDLSHEDILFIRQIARDYYALLPVELFEHCGRLYPVFFVWIRRWSRESATA